MVKVGDKYETIWTSADEHAPNALAKAERRLKHLEVSLSQLESDKHLQAAITDIDETAREFRRVEELATRRHKEVEDVETHNKKRTDNPPAYVMIVGAVVGVPMGLFGDMMTSGAFLNPTRQSSLACCVILPVCAWLGYWLVSMLCLHLGMKQPPQKY